MNLSRYQAYTNPAYIGQFALGFSSGLPYLLVFSTLTFWLKDNDLNKATIGLFSLVKLPYLFKIFWAPLLNSGRLPWLAVKLGQRRSMALALQVCLMLSIVALAFSNPAVDVTTTALLALTVAFFSASQDIVLDGYRAERFSATEQGMATAFFVTGYRIALLLAGAGALYLAAVMAWRDVYLIMALVQGVGVLAILCSREQVRADVQTSGSTSWWQWVVQNVWAPFYEFTTRPAWGWLLALVLLYKFGYAYQSVMVNVFYDEAGFTKPQIAEITKIYGFFATIIGTFVGGSLVARVGIYKSLLAGAWLQVFSLLLFTWLATQGASTTALAMAVTLENFCDGIGSTAYLTLFAVLCRKEYSVTQFAALTSLMALSRDVLAASSGYVAEGMDWVTFFLVCTALALPALLLLYILKSTIIAYQHKEPAS